MNALDGLDVVAIFFWGRAGSVFLHSLFDSHPQVLTIPATRLNAFHGRQWDEIQSEPTLAGMVRRFTAWNPSVFDGREDRWMEGLDCMGPDRRRALYVDRTRFEQLLLARLPVREQVSRKTFFLQAHLAYALARGEDVSRKTTLVYHLHSPEAYANIERALEDFPTLRGIGVTREPIRSVLSYLRKNVIVARMWGHEDRAEYHQLPRAGGYNFVYRHQLQGWRELVARQRMPLRAVRIEDLNRDTEGEMRKLAAELGLDWHPSLIQSTFNGLEYHGDQQTIGGANAVQVRTPSKEESERALDRLDRYVLEGLLARFREEFGYGETTALQQVLSGSLLLLPTRLERLDLLDAVSELLQAESRGDGARHLLALLQNVHERHVYSYRHLLCEALPWIRAWTRLPRGLSPGLALPAKGG